MLDADTKRRIDTARDILVGKVPDPKSQVEQITIALIYKFMDDMDTEAEEFGGKRKFFAGEFERYGWAKLMRSGLGGHEMLGLYGEAIAKMPENPGIPLLFRDIFKNAYLPYRDPETLRAFLKIIDEFSYDHSEKLGDAYEYLLSVLGSQGNAGQFRTPRHIIDFIVDIIDPKKTDTILDPACGSAGFLISAWKHILRANTSKPSPQPSPNGRGSQHFRGGYDFSGLKDRARELRKKQTEAEAFLWELLRNRQLAGVKFRRQHQLGDYICDFYCHEANLVVECDGEVHDSPDQKKHDDKRDAYLKSQGLKVIRFQNDRVLNDTTTVLEEIASHLPAPGSSPSGRGGGEGRPGYSEGSPAMLGDLLTPDERGRLSAGIRGYDIDPLMVRLSLVNLYLHGFADPHIHEYDSLSRQERWNETADVILANPPFMSPKGGITPHNRFTVKSKRSEVLFVDYMAEHLRPNGRAGIIVPEGVIFQSQTAYKQLRKILVEDYLVAVVSLPAGVFQPYSGVKTSILIFDKTLAKKSDSIAFVKIEQDGFGLGAQRRETGKSDLPAAAEFLKNWLIQSFQCLEKFKETNPNALIVEKEKIAANGDYNLSGERYREGVERETTFSKIALGDLLKLEFGTRITKRDDEGTLFPVYGGGGESFRTDSFTRENDVVISRFAMSAECVRVVRGKFYLLDSGFTFSIAEDYQKRTIKDYVTQILLNSQDRIYACARGHAQKNIDINAFKELQIPLPPLEIQKEIVAEIEGYQKVIDGARAVLDNYRPHIPIHPDWPLVELSEIIDSLESGVSVNSTNRTITEGEVGILKTSCVTSGVFDPNEHKAVRPEERERAKCHPKKNSIIISRMNTEKLVGANAYVNEDYEHLYLPDRLWQTVISRTDVHVRYLQTVLASDTYRERISAVCGGTSGSMKNISKSALLQLDVPLPPLAEQQAIVAEIEAEQALANANRELITRMEAKIQSVLSRIWGEEAHPANKD